MHHPLLLVIVWCCIGFAICQDAAMQGIVDLHTRERQMVGAPPLQWDSTLERVAIEWARSCPSAARGTRHSDGEWRRTRYVELSGGQEPPGGSIGENLAYGAITTPRSAQLWFDEKRDWDCASDRCLRSICGHYRQAVWDQSTHIGCAYHRCSDNDNLLVCMYASWGNLPDERPFPASQCGGVSGNNVPSPVVNTPRLNPTTPLPNNNNDNNAGTQPGTVDNNNEGWEPVPTNNGEWRPIPSNDNNNGGWTPIPTNPRPLPPTPTNNNNEGWVPVPTQPTPRPVPVPVPVPRPVPVPVAVPRPVPVAVPRPVPVSPPTDSDGWTPVPNNGGWRPLPTNNNNNEEWTPVPNNVPSDNGGWRPVASEGEWTPVPSNTGARWAPAGGRRWAPAGSWALSDSPSSYGSSGTSTSNDTHPLIIGVVVVSALVAVAFVAITVVLVVRVRARDL